MEFFGNLILLLDTEMETPTAFGWFHTLSWILMLGLAVLLCVLHKRNPSEERVRRVVFFVALAVFVLEIYKTVNFSFSYEDGKIVFDYPWYAFPWQFCSTPMYAGLLTGIFRRGRVHDALCAFLATYAIFAGAAVMVYPGDVFISTVGINIQTMVCHGSMITVGIYLWYSGYVKAEHKTILRALPVFVVAIGVAMLLNEIANAAGLLAAGHNFNMFYISPYCDPHLPVYSDVQRLVPYPFCLIIYIAAFTLVAYLISLAAMGIKALSLRISNKKETR
jgi:hypothetical protein